ncbi:PH domain-containing protein [Agromyces sp. SYSU T00194]|uniref:PH domain-containing protein n=1 Tax=Agromyces chitinivorans TaxID=3158560 RepID=UPI003396E863
MSEVHVFRPRFGRWLAGAVFVACGVGFVAAFMGAPGDLFAYTPMLALLAFAAWAAYWRPSVRIDDEGVEVANVFRTTRVPWGQIRRIDTRYALMLETTHGRLSAWAAPAPGRYSLLFAQREHGTHLPESSYVAGTVRPGDLVSSDSGAAAYLVRRRWEELRDSDRLVDDGSPRDVRWHVATIAGFAVLILATVLGVVV